jgi:uncharacterized protein YhaN
VIFRALHLKAVGPFTDVVLDLSGGHFGTHIILGANEAGKSSALRAVSYLLFGFPRQDLGDAFLHRYPELRVGGTLIGPDGEILEVLRRKRDQNTLFEADDKTPVAEERLRRLMGGIEKATFEGLLGIDHVRLRRGGEDIREGKGELGGLLFAAGAGLAGLKHSQRRLRERMDVLFKPKAQNPRINAALIELDQAREGLRQGLLPCEEWQEHDRALRETKEAAETVQGQLAERRRELGRLQRLGESIPLIARRHLLNKALEALGDAVVLRPEFGQECRERRSELARAAIQIEQATRRLADLARQVEEMVVPEALLAEAREIDELHKKLGEYLKGQEDRPRLQEWRQNREHSARDMLQELGKGRPRDVASAAEPLRHRSDEVQAIRNLVTERTGLLTRSQQAQVGVAERTAEVERLTRKLHDQPALPDVGPLQSAWKRALNAGDLDEHCATARRARQQAEQKAARALKKLPGWSGDLDALEGLPVPLPETIDRLEQQWRELEASFAQLRQREEELGEDLQRADLELARLEGDGHLPAEADLVEARRRRDEGWALVRSAWLEGRQDGAHGFINEFAPGRPLAEAFEASVRSADELADRLRREADRVARKAECQARCESARQRAEGLARELAKAGGQRDKLERNWEVIRGDLKVCLEAPSELRSWLLQRDEVIRLASLAREAREEEARQVEARASHRAAIASLLTQLGEIVPDRSEDLAPVRDQAERFLRKAEKQAKGREQLLTAIEKEEDELRAAEGRRREADVGLESWAEAWGPRAGPLGLGVESTPEQVNLYLERLNALLIQVKDSRDFAARIKGIDRDAGAFVGRVKALVDRVAPDLGERLVAEQVETLLSRRDDASQARARLADLIKQREAETTALEAARGEEKMAAAAIDLLVREADCACPEELDEADRKSREQSSLAGQLRACDEQLLVAAAGKPLDEFARLVERTDRDALDADVRRLEGELAALDVDLTRHNQAIGAEQARLSLMTGGDEGARAAEKVEALLAGLREEFRSYATLKLADAVLRRGIDRYRRKNQGPVLGRAAALFAALTDGSFIDLQVDDEDGLTVIRGVRPGGQSVQVEGMSDGTHDQLYLALRLAVLESWLQSHGPVPFVLDDVLMNFDDRRALAALKALGEFSRLTQVILFTHHQHLVDLARSVLPDDVLFVRELPAARDVAGSGCKVRPGAVRIGAQPKQPHGAPHDDGDRRTAGHPAPPRG